MFSFSPILGSCRLNLGSCRINLGRLNFSMVNLFNWEVARTNWVRRREELAILLFKNVVLLCNRQALLEVLEKNLVYQ